MLKEEVLLKAGSVKAQKIKRTHPPTPDSKALVAIYDGSHVGNTSVGNTGTGDAARTYKTSNGSEVSFPASHVLHRRVR